MPNSVNEEINHPADLERPKINVTNSQMSGGINTMREKGPLFKTSFLQMIAAHEKNIQEGLELEFDKKEVA